ncbi:MAG: DUF4956 domain-containing protein [Flavobacteriaceae bacterium]|jgi:uncharacterized membrane protein YhiD involved in acid resistance|nr:DUF4956 domain-containing protein [Flavobacteriaceae bacterium]
MDNSLIDFFLNENVSISTGNFVQHLLVTLVLSLLVKIVYTRFSTTISNKKEFSKNFVILGLTTCIVITIVKSSLALSLGLVGALSIVRFRAAIKEPEELAYLFLIIAIGLGAGAGQIIIITIGTIVSLTVIVFLYSLNTKEKNKINENLHFTISIDEKLSKKDTDNLIKIIEEHVSHLELSSLNQSNKNLIINLILILKNTNSVTTLNEIILKNYPTANILLNKDHNIAL